MADTNPVRLVWAILSAVGVQERTPEAVVEEVHVRRCLPVEEVRECLDALIARGHLVLDDGILRPVHDSGIKSTAMVYGLDEEDVALVFHMLNGAVAAGDTETIDHALRHVIAARDAAVPKRSRRRPDA